MSLDTIVLTAARFALTHSLWWKGGENDKCECELHHGYRSNVWYVLKHYSVHQFSLYVRLCLETEYHMRQNINFPQLKKYCTEYKKKEKHNMYAIVLYVQIYMEQSLNITTT